MVLFFHTHFQKTEKWRSCHICQRLHIHHPSKPVPCIVQAVRMCPLFNSKRPLELNDSNIKTHYFGHSFKKLILFFHLRILNFISKIFRYSSSEVPSSYRVKRHFLYSRAKKRSLTPECITLRPPQLLGKLHHREKLLLLLLLSQISPQVCLCIIVLFMYYRIISMQFQIMAHLRTNLQLELLCKQLFNSRLFIPKKISAITASFRTYIINTFFYLLRYSRFGARLKVSLVAPIFFTCNTSHSLQTAGCIIRKKLGVEGGC